MLAVTNMNGFGAGGFVGAPPPETPEYTNPGGTGDRTALIDVTYGAGDGSVVTSGTLSNLVDGSVTADSSGSIQFPTTRGQWVQFDFKVGVIKLITEITLKFDNSTAQGTWWVLGSQDAANWHILAGDTIFNQTNLIIPLTVSGGFRYYRLHQRSGTASLSTWFEEAEFKICNSTAYVNPNRLTPNYLNPGSVGPREAMCTVSTPDLGTQQGDITNLLDGNIDDNINVTWRPTNNAPATKDIIWDFGVGASKVITEFRHLQDLSTTHGTWQFAGSNDNVSYTDIGTTYTLGGGTDTTINTMSANTTGYRYYRERLTSGATSLSNTDFIEREFKIADKV